MLLLVKVTRRMSPTLGESGFEGSKRRVRERVGSRVERTEAL